MVQTNVRYVFFVIIVLMLKTVAQTRQTSTHSRRLLTNLRNVGSMIGGSMIGLYRTPIFCLRCYGDEGCVADVPYS